MTHHPTPRALASGLAAAWLALASHSAWAQSGTVQLSGLVDLYAGSMKFAGDGERRTTVGSNGMTTSWIGVTGTEELGGGLKAGFALTSFLRPTTGAQGRFDSDTFWSRDANLSLSSSLGTVRLGRWMAPNFLPTVLFNAFGDSFTFSPLILHANVPLFNGTQWVGTTQADTGWGSQIAYTTPKLLGGLSATLQYQLREGGSSGKNYGGNLIYLNGPIGLAAFYERTQLSNPTVARYADGSSRTNWMLGGSYDLQAAKLYLTYGQSKNKVSNAKLKTASASVLVPLGGAGKLRAAYAHTRNHLLNAKRQTLTLGYGYELSKRTDLYANVMHDKITRASSGTSYAVGLRHRF